MQATRTYRHNKEQHMARKANQREKWGDQVERENLISFLLPHMRNVPSCSYKRTVYHRVPRTLTLQSLEKVGTFCVRSIRTCRRRGVGHWRVTFGMLRPVSVRSVVKREWGCCKPRRRCRRRRCRARWCRMLRKIKKTQKERRVSNQELKGKRPGQLRDGR